MSENITATIAIRIKFHASLSISHLTIFLPCFEGLFCQNFNFQLVVSIRITMEHYLFASLNTAFVNNTGNNTAKWTIILVIVSYPSHPI